MFFFAILFYGLVPVAGAFIERRRWRLFRNRFDELRHKPYLDYTALVSSRENVLPVNDVLRVAEDISVIDEYRFTGTFDCIGSDAFLWVRSDGLTVQANLEGAHIYLFPNKGDKANLSFFDPGEEAPERIRWDRISALTGDVKVFVGGPLVKRDGRCIFESFPGFPLLIILYEGAEKTLAVRAIRAGRHRNEYFNFLTPFAFVLGVFSQLIIAISLLARPEYKMTMIISFIALFTPIIPFIPPGLIFTLLYRNLWWRARLYRSYRDLARYPIQYFSKGESRGLLPGGEIYVQKRYDTLSPEIFEKLPLLIPAAEKRKKSQWNVFGSLAQGQGDDAFPAEPLDKFMISCILPGDSETLAKNYNRKAYFLEIISWLLLLAGIGINFFVINLILMQLGV